MAASTSKRQKRMTLQYSDPGKMLDLVMNLVDDSCAAIQVKINNYLHEDCEAELVFMVIVNVGRKEAFIETIGQTILPKKMKIGATQKLLDILKTQVERSELLSKMDTEIQDIVNPYVQNDPQQGKAKKRVVMLPVLDQPMSVITCVVASNFTEERVGEIIYECFLFTWPILKKTLLYEYERTLKQKCQRLLKVAKTLFTQVSSLEVLLQITMEQAKSLTKSEHCSVKMIDFHKMELVEVPNRRNTATYGEERRFSMNRGIVGEVLRTGILVNCRTAKEHSLYRPDIDSLPDINCRNVICFPIREQTGIIGVGQLFNKIGDPYYDGMDEEMALAFSIYCGVCIMHSMVYKKIEEAHIRNALANELIMYHMKVTDAEVQKVLECNAFHGHPHACSLHFNPRAIPERELPCYVFKMYKDLGLISKFDLKPDKLVRFILHVKKGYRDVPYHRWLHGFNVAHFAHAAMLNFKLMSSGYISELQGLMYLTAALVHDLDHRGTTNSFQMQGQTTLAALYSSEGSVMERHHLSQAMCILNTQGCDLLESLPRRDYDRAIMMLRDFILATDLSNYFKNLSEYEVIARDFNKNSKTHNSALLCLLMNAADLGDQLKDWGSVKKTAAAVLTEFFKQGDVEKERGDLPAIIMDREKCVIPELEIEFLSTICIPLYTMLGQIIPRAQSCVKIIENHIERWDASKPVFAEVPILAGLSVLLSPELDTLIEANMMEKARLAEEAAQEALRLAAEAKEAAEKEAAAAAAAAAAEEDD